MKNLTTVCPACSYKYDLLSALADGEQREYWRYIQTQNLSTERLRLMFRYLGYFAPPKYAMSFSALYTRTESLLSQVTSGKVIRAGNTRVAPPELWWQVIELLVTNKPDALSLPLKSHNYLCQIVFNEADRAAAKAEEHQINEQRNRHHADLNHLKSMKEFLNNPAGDTTDA